MEFIFLLWPLAGIIAHIVGCNKMKTWCGTPIWDEPTTYAMFLPAAAAGPIFFIVNWLYTERET